MPKLVNDTLHTLRAFVRAWRPSRYVRARELYANMMPPVYGIYQHMNMPYPAYYHPRRQYFPTVMPVAIGMPFVGIRQEDSIDHLGLIGRTVRSVTTSHDFDSDDSATWRRIWQYGLRAEQHIERIPSIYARMGDMTSAQAVHTGVPAYKRTVVKQQDAQSAACDTAKRHHKAQQARIKHAKTPKYVRGGGAKPGKFKARFR